MYTHIQATTGGGSEGGEGVTGMSAGTGARHPVAHAWAPRSPSAAAVAAAEGMYPPPASEGLASSAGEDAKTEGLGGGGGGGGGSSGIRIDEELSSQVM